jgi:hypothetical protein
LRGGGDKVIPMYTEPKNNPNIPIEQKRIFSERIADKGDKPIRTNNTAPQGTTELINLQVFQPSKPVKEVRPPIEPIMFMPSYATNPYNPPQFSNGMTFVQPIGSMYGGFPSAPMPIIKHYSINTNGPTDNHARLSMIYEDVLPGKELNSNLMSLGDRLSRLSFIRAVMFNGGDGADTNLDGTRSDSLLSRVKLMELNPYSQSKVSANPYMGMPDGFLIYRSCYPIRNNETDSRVMCARNSIGGNVRIYKLTEGAYSMYSNDTKQYSQYDQWRDIAYYEYIKEHILKKKMCPNFVVMYGYYIALNSNIDFNKIAEIQLRDKKAPLHGHNIKIDEPVVIEPTLKDYMTSIGSLRPIVPVLPTEGIHKPTTFVYRQSLIEMMTGKSGNDTTKLKIIDTYKPDEYKGKTLVALTEAANYSIDNWASVTYQVEGNIKRMINRGHHDEKTWLSVLFQLMAALYTMQIKEICINNFKLQTNVFIKDLSIAGNVTNHWKYKIDNVDYYVPNCGFLTLIDSDYKDINDDTSTHFIIAGGKTPKVDGPPFGAGNKEENIKMKTFEMFKNSFDKNNFKGEFITAKGIEPPTLILTLLDGIKSEADTDKDYDIGKYIRKYMTMFMNNRIGTYLKEQEISNIRKDDLREFKTGHILVHEDGHGTYRFVLFLGTENGNSIILTKFEPAQTDMITKTIAVSLLFNYNKAEPITQNFKINESNLNEDDLIETYVIMK